MNPVSARAFSAIQKVDTITLSKLSERELRPLLPCLVRMALCPPLDVSEKWAKKRKEVLKILAGIEFVNSLVGLLSIDFHSLEIDIKKEQSLRQKLGGAKSSESILVQSLQNGFAIEFEQSDAARKLRLVLSEVLTVYNQVPDVNQATKSSELLDNEIYLEEVSDVLCIAQAEVLSLLSLPTLAEALLYFRHGPLLICRLVANAPDSFVEVYTRFIANSAQQDEDNMIENRRCEVLKMLCKMNPSYALTVRAFAVENCKLPSLAVALTLDHCKQEQAQLALKSDSPQPSDSIISDLVAFVSGLLLGSDTQVRSWFSHFIRSSQKKTDCSGQMLLALRQELIQMLRNVAPSTDSDPSIPENKVVQASTLLKLYCALKGIAGLKFNDDEVNMLLQVITSHPPPSPAGVHFVSIGLCVIIACPSLINNIDQEKKAVTWIRWLIQEEANFERQIKDTNICVTDLSFFHFNSRSGVTASFGEMLLLLAIHFHGEQIQAISDLISSTLWMKIIIKTNSLTRIKNIFTHDIFTEKVVAAHAIRVPVTPNLSAKVQGFLPVHCIHQLLRSRAFSKYQVPIKSWIYNQICNAVAPLHSVLPPLIEVYVTSIIIPSSPGKASPERTNKPIDDEEIFAVFSDSFFGSENMAVNSSNEPYPSITKTSSLTSQLLLLYYLMLYEDCRLMNMKNIVNSGYKVKCYSDQLLSQLPIKYLLQQAQKEQQNYAGLFAPLLKLLASHYPHLCLPQGWIREIETSDATDIVSHTTKFCFKLVSSKQIEKAFTSVHETPCKLIVLLDALFVMPVSEIWKFAECFVAQIPMLLQPDIPRQILNKTQKIWWKLNSVFPRRLWVMTVQALQIQNEHSHRLRHDDVVLDPLNVLRCDERVFRCPPIYEIVLHILKAFLAASQRHLSRHILNNPMSTESMKLGGNGLCVENDNDRDELKVALVAAQESAAVQILLETCLMSDEEKNSSTVLSNLQEVQCLVCSHLHEIFIEQPSLAKLVHFQGYPRELIPMAVSGIPSMHICLDFIPELLGQPQIEKQAFGIELISHLSLKYALPKALSIARLAVQVLSTLISVLSTDKHCEVFAPLLPALVRICQAFPPLCEDVVNFLLQLGCVSSSLSSFDNASSPRNITDFLSLSPSPSSFLKHLKPNNPLGHQIQQTFTELCEKVILNEIIY
ncbi:Integrator complex subunit 2 [Nymphon striatum]|nr:Integrator complex subunit 2 [Nymphon striatum]